MNEKLDKLREIGAQKIYEDTHIPIEHVQAIIHESFESFSKVQFLGFISILEREYDQDLSSLRESGIKFFDEKKVSKNQDTLFITPKHKSNYAPFYILVVVIVFLLAFYFTTDKSNAIQTIETNLIDNSIIEDAQKNIALVDMNESNESVESNESNQSNILLQSNEELNTTLEEEIIVVPTLSILTKKKVWTGYIELKTNAHHETTVQNELKLDGTKDWLIVLGHGFIEIILNGEVQKFTTTNSVRFLYKDGKIKAITPEEFKRYNKGRLW